MSRQSCEGLSAIELLIVLAIAGTIAAMAIPATSGMVNEFSLNGDAHGVSNSFALARMAAAANFTRARVYIDLGTNRYRIEQWNKTTSAWDAKNADQPLGSLNTFSSGAITTPPPNSAVAVGPAAQCLNNGGAAIANTACVIFNSRGVPVDGTGGPTAASVIYLSGPTAVYAVVVSSTSQLAMWRISPAGTTWDQK